MATKAQVAQLEYEKHCLRQKIISLEETHKKELEALNKSHEEELAKLKEALRPVTLGEVRDLIDEAIHKLSLDAESAPWDSDDGHGPTIDVTLYYGNENLGSANV